MRIATILATAVVALLVAVGGGIARTEAPGRTAAKLTVSGQANVFGAGLSAPPAPGGGGGGKAPTAYSLPAGAAQVTFSGGAGSVTCCTGFSTPPYNGPAGGTPLTPAGTSVAAAGSLSGVYVSNIQMFLVGVFLGGSAPSGSPPPTDTITTSPALRQVFYVGAGPRTVNVPVGATRLFLGFADAYGFHGAAGYYADNAGAVQIDLSVSTRPGSPPAAPATRHTWSLVHHLGGIWRDRDNNYFLALQSVNGRGGFTVSRSAVTKAHGNARVAVLVSRAKWAPNGHAQSFGLTAKARGAKFHSLGGGSTLTLPVTVTPTALQDADIECLADPDGTLILRDGGSAGRDSFTLISVCGIRRGNVWSHANVVIAST